MSGRQPRIVYKVAMLRCNLVPYFPASKVALTPFLDEICAELKEKTRVQEAVPTNEGILITFISDGLTPVEAHRFTLSVDEIVKRPSNA